MFPTNNKAYSCKNDYLYKVDVLQPKQDISSTYLPLSNMYSFTVKKACNPWMLFDSLHQKRSERVVEYFATTTLD